MTLTNLDKFNKIIINTGNIISLNDITKKPGQNPTEEIIDAVSITIKDKTRELISTDYNQPIVISRQNDDLNSKITEQDISDLKIGVKIFLGTDDESILSDALEKALLTLNVSSLSNVVIAFNHKKESVEDLKSAWGILEKFVQSNKICQIGIADIDENIFVKLYETATVKPSIIQINLATCCVVPPTLQAFCKENDVQLLTHSDPNDILPKDSIESILGKPFCLNWLVKFMVHIKGRGVLITKGYLLHLQKQN